MQTYFYKNIPFAYTLIGSTENVLVLLHGFGEDSSVFKEQVDYFTSKDYSVLIIDFPGCGNALLTPKLLLEDITKVGSIVFLAEAVVHIIQYLALTNITIVGHSMGGYVALEIEHLFPTITNKFGLLHSTAFADSEEKKVIRKKGIDVMEEYGGAAFLKNTIPNLFAAVTKKSNPSIIDALIEQASSLQTKALQQFYWAMLQRPDRTLVLQQTAKPVLFIIGTEDIATPLTDVIKQTHLPTISYIHVLENVGHMGMLEAPMLINQYIEQFIQ